MISVAIMAHPSRQTWADALGEQLDAPVVYDTDGVEWHTGRRALLEHDPGAEWHVVVQDDALICDEFTRAVETILEHVDGQPVGLYVGTVRPQRFLVERALAAAQRAGLRWIDWEGPKWGVAVAIPTGQIPALVADADLDPHPHYDARLRRHYKRSGITCRYPVPSLVDHRPRSENPSLICKENADRRARLFERDALSVDWNTPALVVDKRGRFTLPERLAT